MTTPVQPIQAGDICEVINALGRGKSPNIGLQVTAESRTGEHSTLGVVWKCTAPGIKQLGDCGQYISAGWADFPAAWLRKIEDKPPKVATDTREELTA